MPSKKLPPPPASSRGRPLPPEPASKSDDVPPPLPSRPGQRHVPTMPAPPTPQSPESSDEEDLTYEEADAPAIPPPVVRQAPPPDPPVEQETYDEFEGMGDSNQGYADDPGETYDACDIQEESIPASSAQDEALYEEGDDMDDQLYEFVAEDKQPAVKSPLPPPAPSHPAPSHGAPSLPSRPPPSRHNDTESQDTTPDDSEEETPCQNNFMAEIARARGSLKHKAKLEHNNVPQKSETHVTPPTDTANLSIKERIALMKGKSIGGIDVNAGPKPKPPMKPNTITAKPSTPVKPMKPHDQVRSGSPQNQHNNEHSSKTVPQFGNYRQAPPTPIKPSSMSSSSSTSNQNSQNHLEPQSIQKTPETKSPPPVPSPTTPRRLESPPLPPPPPAVGAYEEDIYDEGFSYMPDPLNAEEWYHGEIERNDSNQKLQHIGQNGTFLVRKSKQGGENQPYTLVVLYKGHVYNLKMRLRNDGQIALGEAKADELAFQDVPALVQHHKAHDVILVNVKENKQYKTLLKKHPISMNGK